MIHTAECKTMDRKSTSASNKQGNVPTESRTFRLRRDEIAFLESLSDKNITAGLRKLIAFGRSAGCADISIGGADVLYTLIARVERLELAQSKVSVR